MRDICSSIIVSMCVNRTHSLRIYDGYPSYILSECVLFTHIDTIIEEHISRIGYKSQASIRTSYVSPLHLIEGKGMYTLYYSTIVDYMTLRDPVDAKGGPLPQGRYHSKG